MLVTSEAPTLISAKIETQELVLQERVVGNTTVFVMAFNANGGLAIDAFDVAGQPIVSSDDSPSILQNIVVPPNLSKDFIQVLGATAGHGILLISMDKSYQQNIPVSGGTIRIDLSPLPAGMYLLLLTNTRNGSRTVEKVIKY